MPSKYIKNKKFFLLHDTLTFLSKPDLSFWVHVARVGGYEFPLLGLLMSIPLNMLQLSPMWPPPSLNADDGGKVSSIVMMSSHYSEPPG